MDPIIRSTAHRKHSGFRLSVGQGWQTSQACGNRDSIYLPHQMADLFFIPEDVREIRKLTAYIMIGDA